MDKDKWQTLLIRFDKMTLETLSNFCGEFLIHGVDVEGLMSGIDADLINILKESPMDVFM